jgi:hypothetical protein
MIHQSRTAADDIPRAAAQSKRHMLAIFADQVSGGDNIDKAHLLEELGLAGVGLIGRVAYRTNQPLKNG